MRLLGWMQHKIRADPFSCFTTANQTCCLSAESAISDYDFHKKRTFGRKSANEGCETPYPEIEAVGLHDNYESEAPTMMSELFNGFLAIGTLGAGPMNSEPGTPTFPISWEDVSEEQAEVTENDLRLLNEELEKFLVAEAEEDDSDELMPRCSYVSTITLTGMQMEAEKDEECGQAVPCPLQAYLFRSSVEFPETKMDLKKEKLSLREMFRGTKDAEAIIIPAEYDEKEEMQGKKSHKSARNILGKLFKKLHASSGNTPTPSNSIKKKFTKVLKMFQRKVHPVNYASENEFKKSTIRSDLQDGGYIAELKHHDRKDEALFVQELELGEGHYWYSRRNLPQYVAASVNGEYWIKTDADYLVLEL